MPPLLGRIKWIILAEHLLPGHSKSCGFVSSFSKGITDGNFITDGLKAVLPENGNRAGKIGSLGWDTLNLRVSHVDTFGVELVIWDQNWDEVQ